MGARVWPWLSSASGHHHCHCRQLYIGCTALLNRRSRLSRAVSPSRFCSHPIFYHGPKILGLTSASTVTLIDVEDVAIKMMHFSKPMNAFFEKHTRANRKRAKEVKLSVNVLKVMSPPSPASFVSPEIVDIHDDSGYSYNARGDELLTFASLMPASDEDLVMISGWYGVEGEDMGNIRDNVAATGAGSQPSTQSHPYNSNLQNLAYDSNPNMPSSKTNPDLNLKLIHVSVLLHWMSVIRSTRR